MKAVATACVVLLSLALGACGDRVENTDMPQPEQAIVEINRQGMDGAKDETLAGGVAHDTASMGSAPEGSTQQPDARIASEVKAKLAADRDLGAMNIAVESTDGVVTLRGRAPDAASRERAAELARGVAEVKRVDNELTLG